MLACGSARKFTQTKARFERFGRMNPLVRSTPCPVSGLPHAQYLVIVEATRSLGANTRRIGGAEPTIFFETSKNRTSLSRSTTVSFRIAGLLRATIFMSVAGCEPTFHSALASLTTVLTANRNHETDRPLASSPLLELKGSPAALRRFVRFGTPKNNTIVHVVRMPGRHATTLPQCHLYLSSVEGRVVKQRLIGLQHRPSPSERALLAAKVDEFGVTPALILPKLVLGPFCGPSMSDRGIQRIGHRCRE